MPGDTLKDPVLLLSMAQQLMAALSLQWGFCCFACRCGETQLMSATLDQLVVLLLPQQVHMLSMPLLHLQSISGSTTTLC